MIDKKNNDFEEEKNREGDFSEKEEKSAGDEEKPSIDEVAESLELEEDGDSEKGEESVGQKSEDAPDHGQSGGVDSGETEVPKLEEIEEASASGSWKETGEGSSGEEKSEETPSPGQGAEEPEIPDPEESHGEDEPSAGEASGPLEIDEPSPPRGGRVRKG